MSGLYGNEVEDRKTTMAFLENSGFGRSDAEEMSAGLFEAQSVTCQLRALSEVITEEKVDRIDLLKIDVEKAEKDVLDGIHESDWPKITQVVPKCTTWPVVSRSYKATSKAADSR